MFRGSTELYQKLVRDRIPQLIYAAGDVPTWSRLTDDDAYVAALCDKVIEEVGELRAASTAEHAEELADLLEVVQALACALGVAMSDVQPVAAHKRAERGGFGGRVWLEQQVALGDREP
ncbi:MAG: phosphoribosyl-ATP pyrophosphohydrolase [Amycolatopsis sp.]|nr:phosphoribosyl-ATP pyrophosphohydrolase [Amycolatopsis sp.]